MKTLILELLTEELPPKSLLALSDFFTQQIFEGLLTQGFLSAPPQNNTPTGIATPRRLGLILNNVAAQAPAQNITEKILPVAIALDATGQASPILNKKIAAICAQYGITFSLQDCVRKQDGKTESFFYTFTQAGISLEIALQKLLSDVLATLPIAKVMQYQLASGKSVSFVRPVHRLLALLGDSVIPLKVLGITSDRYTEGHRFLAPPLAINIPHADHYLDLLRAAMVEPIWSRRYRRIEDELVQEGQKISLEGQVIRPKKLIEEVCALVEWPAVYPCSFDREFLLVPQECLILTMQQNQKYFVVKDKNDKLLPHFLVVSNIKTTAPEKIINGNEKVVRPRLADAAFFYQQDQKITLATREKSLSKMIFHQNLGSQAQRTARIIEIIQTLSPTKLSPTKLTPTLTTSGDNTKLHDHITRAAALCKTDLQTEMVMEFPELQGTMGGYYASLAGEDPVVAQAISEHYLPRFSIDALPQGEVGTLLSLADKLDSLIGFFGVGMRATGEKDPFALRRLALAICRLLIEKKLFFSFHELIALSLPAFSSTASFNCDTPALIHFLNERLRSYLKDQKYPAEIIESVVSLNHAPASLPLRIASLSTFLSDPEATNLIASYKRINNILTKSTDTSKTITSFVNASLFEEAIEQQLWSTYLEIKDLYFSHINDHQFLDALNLLKKLNPLIEVFFNNVMIFTPVIAQQNNRVALIKEIRLLLNAIADFSFLSI